jgi:Resolvase, N terminal domain
VVTKIDRLALSIPDLVKIIGTLEEKSATLNILAMNLGTSTPTGRLLIHLVGLIDLLGNAVNCDRVTQCLTWIIWIRCLCDVSIRWHADRGWI